MALGADAAQSASSLAGVPSEPDPAEMSVVDVNAASMSPYLAGADHLTSRFGTVIRPVSRLIESMTQVEALFGIRHVPSPVMNV